MKTSKLIELLKATQEDKNGAPIDLDIIVSHGDFYYKLVDVDTWYESDEVCLMTGGQCGIS